MHLKRWQQSGTNFAYYKVKLLGIHKNLFSRPFKEEVYKTN
jgi:hypothetical protein